MRGECLCCYKYKKKQILKKPTKKIDDEDELRGGG